MRNRAESAELARQNLPEGFRLLEKGEKILKGDLFFSQQNQWQEVTGAAVGAIWTNKVWEPVARQSKTTT